MRPQTRGWGGIEFLASNEDAKRAHATIPHAPLGEGSGVGVWYFASDVVPSKVLGFFVAALDSAGLRVYNIYNFKANR